MNSKHAFLPSAIVLLIAFSCSPTLCLANGTLLRDTRNMGSYPVNTKDSDKSVRLASYRTAIKAVFPEVCDDCLDIAFEHSDLQFGTTVVLAAYRDSLPVVGSKITLRISRNDSAAYASAHYYTGVDIPRNEAFLDFVSDSAALDSFARVHWTAAANDSVLDIGAGIVAIEQADSSYAYQYVLGFSSQFHYPSLWVDWPSGDIVKTITPNESDINVSLSITYRNYPSSTFQTVPATGIGRVRTRDGWGYLCGDAFNPNDGSTLHLSHCDDDEFLMQIYGETPFVQGWEHCYLDGGGIAVDWNHPYRLADHSCDCFAANIHNGHDLSFTIDNWDDGSWDDPVVLYHMNRVSRYYEQRFGDFPRTDFATGTDAGISGATYRPYWTDWNQLFHPEFNHPHTLVAFGLQNGLNHAQNQWTICHEAAHCWQTVWYEDEHWGTVGHPCSEWAWIQEGTANAVSAFFCSGPLGSWVGDASYFNYANILNNTIPCQPSPSPGPYERARVLCGGLWDLRNDLNYYGCLPDGFTDADDYMTKLVSEVLIQSPSFFEDFAKRMLWEDDVMLTGALDLSNGSPNGYYIYKRLIQERGIHDSQGNFSVYSNGIAPLYTGTAWQTTSTAGTAPGSNRHSMSAPGIGLVTVHTSGTDVIYSRSTDNGTSWRTYRLNGTAPSQQAFDPCIDVSGSTVYVSWRDAIQQVHVWEQTYGDYGYPECDVVWHSRVFTVPGQPTSITAPAILGRQRCATVYVGASGGSSPGVHYWRAPDNGLGEWTHEFLPASEGHNPTSLAAACPSMNIAPVVTWIASDNVFFSIGNCPPSGAWTWTTATNISSGVEAGTNKSEVTIAYNPTLRGIVAAWEATGGAWSRRNIYVRHAVWPYDQTPQWCAISQCFSLLDCGELRHPSLCSVSDEGYGGDLNRGTCPVGLAWEEWIDGLGAPWIRYTGMRIRLSDMYNMSHWGWLEPVNLARGRAPAVSRAVWRYGGCDQEIMYTRLTGATSHPLALSYVWLTYRDEDPPPPWHPPTYDTLDDLDTLSVPGAYADTIVVRTGQHLVLRAPCDGDIRTVTFLPGAGIVVEPGGRLEISGEDDVPIVMKAYDSTQSWSGIKVEKGGSLYMEYVNMFDTDSFCVSAVQPDGEGYPVSIQNCYFDGRKLAEGAYALRFVQSSPLSEEPVVRVKNSRIDSVAPGAAALYILGGGISFLDDTIRGAIQVKECAQNHVEFQDDIVEGCQTGVTIEGSVDSVGSWVTPTVVFDRCTIRDCTTGVSLHSQAHVRIENSTVMNNRTGIWCSNAWLTVDSSEISNNHLRGVYLVSNALGRFSYDTLAENGPDNCNIGSPLGLSGLGVLIGSSADLKCCDIVDNHQGGIAVLMSTVTMADPGHEPEWGWNSVERNDDCAHNGQYGTQIVDGCGSTMILDNGGNNIRGGDSSNQAWWVFSANTDRPLWCRQNYWWTTDTSIIRAHLPENAVFYPIRTTPGWCPGITLEATDDSALAVFLSAKHDVLEEEYSSAKEKLWGLTWSWTGYPLAMAAMNEIVRVDLLTHESASSVSLFEDHVEKESDRETRLAAEYAYAWSMAYSGDFDGGAKVVLSLLDSAQSDTENVTARIALLNLDLVRQSADTADEVTAEELQAVMDSIDYLMASLDVKEWTECQIFSDTTMYAPCRVTCGLLEVYYGAKLTIMPYPGTTWAEVRFDNSVLTAHQGTIEVLGEPDCPVILTATPDSTLWLIRIESGTLVMKHAHLRGIGICGDIREGSFGVQIDSCDFSMFGDGLWIWPNDSTCYIRNSTLHDMGGHGWFGWEEGKEWGACLTVFGGHLSVENCTIQNGEGVGIVNLLGTTDIVSTTISGCAGYGLLNWGDETTVSCSEFSYNGHEEGEGGYPEIVSEGWSRLNLDDGSRTRLLDSTGVLAYTDFPAYFEIDGGKNAFILEGEGERYYLESSDPGTQWDISGNYWSPYSPDTAVFFDHMKPDSQWVCDDWLEEFDSCGEGGMASVPSPGGGVLHDDGASGTDSWHSSKRDVALTKTTSGKMVDESKVGPIRKTLADSRVAMTRRDDVLARRTTVSRRTADQRQQEQAQWRVVSDLCRASDKQTAAQATMQFISDYPTSPRLPAALVRLSGMASVNNNEVSTFLAAQAKNQSDPRICKLAQRKSFVALAREGKARQALAGLERIMDTADTPRDSIQALVDAMCVYASNLHLDKALRPRHASVACRDLPELGRRVIALSRILLETPEGDVQRAAIPAKYHLYQNYPNPFNPNTEIRFDLPEAVKVQLKIFNILGQEVTTLLDEVRPAGAHTILWDSKSATGVQVASGVYIYQIKAGSFVDSKKMVLIR